MCLSDIALWLERERERKVHCWLAEFKHGPIWQNDRARRHKNWGLRLQSSFFPPKRACSLVCGKWAWQCTEFILHWNASSSVFISCMQGHTEELMGLAVSSTSQWAATCGRDNCLRVWNTQTGKTILAHISILRDLLTSAALVESNVKCFAMNLV